MSNQGDREAGPSSSSDQPAEFARTTRSGKLYNIGFLKNSESRKDIVAFLPQWSEKQLVELGNIHYYLLKLHQLRKEHFAVIPASGVPFLENGEIILQTCEPNLVEATRRFYRHFAIQTITDRQEDTGFVSDIDHTTSLLDISLPSITAAADTHQTTQTTSSATTTTTATTTSASLSTTTSTTASSSTTNNGSGSGQPPLPPQHTTTSHSGSNMAVRPNLNKIKVPQWMPQEPGAWFRMLELIFLRENITDEADKVLLVLQNVPPSDTQKIVSLAWKASYVAGDYANIKAAIIGMNTISDDEKLNRLFHSESLGDQRPSELYYKMKNLADSVVGGAVPTNVVFNRWVNMLPTNCISFAKALADNFDPAKHLASIDDLHALLANRGGNHVSGISTSRSSRNRSTSRDRSASRNRSSSRDRASSRDRSSSRGRSSKGGSSFDKGYNPDGPLCWYHFRFGKKARKCNKDGCPLRKKGNDNQ